MNQSIQALYDQARHEREQHSAWATLRHEEADAMPACANHPGRPAYGGFEEPLCAECAEWEIRRRRLWLKSFSLVRGGVEALR